ncbi:MAG: hypothetical protein ABSE93_16820 [Terriglobia bacterium]|jgi:hypothetical protein
MRKTTRVLDAFLWRQNLFHWKQVLPAIAKIVFVGELALIALNNFTHPNTPGVSSPESRAELIVRSRVLDVAKNKLMQVGILPSHYSLQNIVDTGRMTRDHN